jgi:hypothetical protein
MWDGVEKEPEHGNVGTVLAAAHGFAVHLVPEVVRRKKIAHLVRLVGVDYPGEVPGNGLCIGLLRSGRLPEKRQVQQSE